MARREKTASVVVTRSWVVDRLEELAEAAESHGDLTAANQARELAQHIKLEPPLPPRSPAETAEAIEDATRELARLRDDLERRTGTRH